jgi:hypothetical protein
MNVIQEDIIRRIKVADSLTNKAMTASMPMVCPCG